MENAGKGTEASNERDQQMIGLTLGIFSVAYNDDGESIKRRTKKSVTQSPDQIQIDKQRVGRINIDEPVSFNKSDTLPGVPTATPTFVFFRCSACSASLKCLAKSYCIL